jgi:hypothetical protein
MDFEHRRFIWPIADTDGKFLGTGFVMHLEEAEAAKCLVYLVTCAHVVKDKHLTVDGEPAKRVDQGGVDAPDLAVIEAFLPKREVDSVRLDAGIYEGAKGSVYGCTNTKTATGDECLITPVRIVVTKVLTFVPGGGRSRYNKAQVIVDLDGQFEPDQIAQGFSGGPVLIDGAVRAVLDANRDLLETQIRSNIDDQKVSKPGKIGTAIPIQRLLEVWPGMLPAVREQIEPSARLWRPLGELISAGSSVPAATAREVFDEAERDLRSWPNRGSANSFADCVQRLAGIDRFQLNDCEYDPLAEFIRRIAERLDDSDLAARLQKMVTDAGFKSSLVPERAILGEDRQTLVIRIVPDIDAIAETGGAGPRLRLMPFLFEQRVAPCQQSCVEVECRSRPIVNQTRLTLLGTHVLETSTADLCEDLRGKIAELFRKFVGGVPDRVEMFLPRAYAASLLNSAVDRIVFRLDFQDASEPEDSFNAWTVVCHHIDERLDDAGERSRLAERLGSCPGTIRLTKAAKSLAQLAKSAKQPYDSVVIDQERPGDVLHHLRTQRSLLCVRFHSPEGIRRNLATAVGAPVPFLALARSPGAVGTLDRLLKKKCCLRQLPRTLKDQIASHDPDADKIAVIVDLPECRCDFDRAIQEPIPNDNL